MIHHLKQLLRDQLFSSVGTRIYSNEVPAGTPSPYVIIEKAGTNYNNTLAGASSMKSVDIRIEISGRTKQATEEATDSIEEFIEDYSGEMGGVICLAVIMEDRDDDFQSDRAETNGGLHSRALSMMIQYKKAE